MIFLRKKVLKNLEHFRSHFLSAAQMEVDGFRHLNPYRYLGSVVVWAPCGLSPLESFFRLVYHLRVLADIRTHGGGVSPRGPVNPVAIWDTLVADIRHEGEREINFKKNRVPSWSFRPIPKKEYLASEADALEESAEGEFYNYAHPLSTTRIQSVSRGSLEYALRIDDDWRAKLTFGRGTERDVLVLQQRFD